MAAIRSALIVASDDYMDPGLRRLHAPAGDAQALAAVLSDPKIGGFEVRTMLNEPAHEVNLAVEEFFADRSLDDLLLVHFSCHGVKDEDGALYFATSNTKLRRLGATAVAADFVNRLMNRSRSRRVVLLLDCCYAGAFERGLAPRAGTDVAIKDQFEGRGRAVITASSAMEYAFEGGELADSRELPPSVFTSSLVQGLQTGEADRDQDGMIALDELYDYVFDKVREATPNQTPGKWTFGVEGDLYIARRSRPVTTPASLPPELHDAIESPLAAVRAGAVPELERLLRSRHAGLALAARLALDRLRDDDSRMVAAAATAARGASAPDSDEAPREDRSGERQEPAQPEVFQVAEKAKPEEATRSARKPAEKRRPARPPRSVLKPEEATRSARKPAEKRRPARPQRSVLIGGAVVAAVLAVAGIAAALLNPDRSGSPPSESGGSTGETEFTAESPWRLVVDNRMGTGCDVTLTKTGADNTGESWRITDRYGTQSFQVQETGTFRWKVNPGCLVIGRSGTGDVTLPFAWPAGGDTDAFEAPDQIAVEVKDFQGNSECDIDVHDARTGQLLDFDKAAEDANTVDLDPQGYSQVYLGDLGCSVRVTAAR